MKTLNSVSFVWPSEKSVFTLIGNELVECRIDQVTLIIEDDENGKRMTVSHYDISNNEGQITSLPNSALFYKSPDAFRAGNQMDNCNYTGHDVLRTAIHHHAAKLWYFNGVESVEYKPEEHVTKVTIDSNRRFNVAEGFVPTELFTKSGQVYAYNSVPIVDLDGNKTEKKGYLNPLLFNEKQKEIMERFKAISKEMRDARIEMFFVEGELSFVNGEHITGHMVSYDRSDEAVDFFPAKEHTDHFLSMAFDCWDPMCVELE